MIINNVNIEEKVFQTLKSSIKFLMNNQLLVKIETPEYRKVKIIYFKREDKKLKIYNKETNADTLTALIIGRKSFYFYKMFAADFEYNDMDIKGILNSIDGKLEQLSKNKLKYLLRLINAIEKQSNCSKIEKFFIFLQDNMEFKFSTKYGFQGVSFKIKQIYKYDTEGKQKLDILMERKDNNRKILEIEKMIESLIEKNKILKEKIKTLDGIILQ